MSIVNNLEGECSVACGGGQIRQCGKFGNIFKEALSDRCFQGLSQRVVYLWTKASVFWSW